MGVQERKEREKAARRAAILEAAKISEEYDMHYWDALLAATMRQNNVLSMYTENAQDFRVPWLNVVDPFGKK